MNICQSVTDRILKQLETGQVPWRRTWATGLPKSLGSGKEYRGVNLLVLSTAPFTSRYWLTYREALRLGGHVRRGERATPVVYWKWRTAEELAERRQKTGKDQLAPCTPFMNAVFNLDQVDGIARPEDDMPLRPNKRLEIADRLLQTMPHVPEIVHTRTNDPAYSVALDRITLPHLSQFENADEYYGTLFHEMVHASGAPHRLNRFAITEGDRFERYSFEELVAEFGAAFLCGFAGINNSTSEALQASYMSGWAAVLRRDNRLIMRAASAAQRATDYIRGKLVNPQDTSQADPTAELSASV